MNLSKALLVAALMVGTAPAYGLSDQDIRVVDEGGIAAWWMLAEGSVITAPGYPEAVVAKRNDVCVALGYVIQSDGTTADHVVVKRWSDAPSEGEVAWDEFGRAASLALSQWRFSPKPGVIARPTFTVATFIFSGAGMPAPDLRARCDVEDVMTAVVAARHDAYERGSINREWLDRAYREAVHREIRSNQANRCRLSHSMAENCYE